MAQNTMNNNAVVVAMSKEEVTMKTKDQIREMLDMVGVELSNTVFKKTKKADLVAMLEKYLDPSKKVEIVEASDTVVEEKKEDTGMSKYMEAKWDKLVKAVASEYVKQSFGRSYALFYKNTTSTTTKAPYLVKSNRLWGATAKVIKDLYGAKHCSEKTIKETLNAMVVRGYLSFQKVQGNNGNINVVFNATDAQMDAMRNISK